MPFSNEEPETDRRLPTLVEDEAVDVSEPTRTLLFPKKIPDGQEALIVLTGNESGRVIPLTAEALCLGRAADCEVMLVDEGVSRRHATIVRTKQNLVLRDNDAKNGTFVNGQRIQSHELRLADEIHLGPTLRLLYVSAGEVEGRLAELALRRSLDDRMHVDRREMVARMVTAVAHEFNTPFGVANTASAFISSIVDELSRTATQPEIVSKLGDLRESALLIQRSLARTSGLVSRFKQLSASQLIDDYTTCDLVTVVHDCLGALEDEAKNRGIVIVRRSRADTALPWKGFPGHVSQVVTSIVENALRHAYATDNADRPTRPDGLVGDRSVEVTVSSHGTRYQIKIQDHGCGVPGDVYPRLFEPFVTSARGTGAAGLGLAIVNNITKNILKGEIVCTTTRDVGTQFVVTVPKTVPTRE